MNRRKRIRSRRRAGNISWVRVALIAALLLVAMLAIFLPRKKTVTHKEPPPAAQERVQQPSAVTPAPPVSGREYVYGPVISLYDPATDAVSSMSLETYIEGVVAGEVPVEFSDEAIKAQAVAARTYALKKVASLGGAPCGRGGADLCTDSAHCQAYRTEAQRRERWGADYEANLGRFLNFAQATAGEIVTYNGGAIEAFFHSTSGGRTENSENAFSQALPYLRGVDSPGEESAPRFSGEAKVTRDAFVTKVNEAYAKANLAANRLEKDVKVLSYFESGRVNVLKLGGAKATGKDVRKLFDLDSANFTISFEKNNVIFSTLGYGHGVGMSQTGADSMARAGASYRQILSHYYTGTQITKVY